MEKKYIAVTYDHSGERYLRDDTGDEVKFTKLINVLLGDEECDVKLAFTREFMGVKTSRPLPVIKHLFLNEDEPAKIRMDGMMEDDSHIDLEIAEDCLLAA